MCCLLVQPDKYGRNKWQNSCRANTQRQGDSIKVQLQSVQ